ncbi:MAG TPA: hypothetical protein VKF80_06570, partial [Candidatus Eisenbacteria bacterium]|nr:hypothetical protein [Candidatus Eisenbacteria bacterium]
MLRILVISVPFSVFFGTLWGNGLHGYIGAYEVSLVFGFVVSMCIRANEAWVVPRLPQVGVSRVRVLIHASSYVVAGMVGAFLGAVITNYTMFHGRMLAGWRSFVMVGLFSLVFTLLFVGVSYAVHFYTAYIERVRDEERFKARVEHEIRTAAQIQQALVPHDRALSPRFEAAGACLPSR